MKILPHLTKDIIQWDVDSWSVALQFWEKNINWKTISIAMELGGREGGLSLWLALKGIPVICSDLRDVQKTASVLHHRHNVERIISYEDIDASNIPYENHFDLIVFKSIIGGIGRNGNKEKQAAVFKQIHKALKPGGKLLFAENLISSQIHQFMRRKFVKWSADWRYVTVDEMTYFMKDFTEVQMKTTGVLAAFGRSESQRRMLSKFDKAIFNYVFPDKSKYIVYGIAVK